MSTASQKKESIKYNSSPAKGTQGVTTIVTPVPSDTMASKTELQQAYDHLKAQYANLAHLVRELEQFSIKDRSKIKNLECKLSILTITPKQKTQIKHAEIIAIFRKLDGTTPVLGAHLGDNVVGLTKELQQKVKEYISLRVDADSLSIDKDAVLELQLEAANRRLNSIIRSFYKFHQDTMFRSYYGMQQFSKNRDLKGYDHRFDKELKELLYLISSMTEVFHVMMHIDYNVLHTVTGSHDNRTLNELILKEAIARLDDLDRVAESLPKTHFSGLTYVGRLCSLLGVSLFIAMAAMSIIMATGITVPAILLSFAATLYATAIASYAITLVSSLLALASIPASASVAAVGTGLLAATTLTLFGATIQRCAAKPSDLASDTIECSSAIRSVLSGA